MHLSTVHMSETTEITDWSGIINPQSSAFHSRGAESEVRNVVRKKISEPRDKRNLSVARVGLILLCLCPRESTDNINDQ